MKATNWIRIGAIFFFVGCIIILISWLITYPVYISDINQITFSQFFPLLWLGIAISLLSVFFITYYCQSKIIQALSCSTIPLILEIPAFFYSYLPGPDAGAVRGMFQIFQKTGINPDIIHYFEFPNFFSLNEIIRQIVGINEKGIGFLSFALYGILLSLFLYLFFFNLKKLSNYQIIPSLLVIIYFIGMYTLIHYQWVPQTLALVYFLILIFISYYLFSDRSKTKWKIIFILIFTSLVFTHAFIPVMFLIFFGTISYKKKFLFPIFLVILSIFLVFTIYHATMHTHLYIETFQQSIQGFGGEYTTFVSRSFINFEKTNILDQIIGIINGIKLPMVWIFVSIGSLVLFIKRKMNILLIALGVAGGVYIATGALFSVLGLRAAQILFIPLTTGLMFFISKWRKLTIAFVLIILILAIFGTMRSAYNQTQFQTDEEAGACDFLANSIKNVTNLKVAVDQVNWGYFTNKLTYLKNVKTETLAIRPGSRGFLNVFNNSLNQNYYILYNSNLGKEILQYLMTKENLTDTLKKVIMKNNKIYNSGTTIILKGIP